MTEQDVILRLVESNDHQRRYELMVPNVFILPDSEADLFAIRRSGFCDEFEVKISRPDFLNDRKKRVRIESEGRVSEGGYPAYENVFKHQALLEGNLPVNYFWYAVREGVAEFDEVPEFAGLIIVGNDRQLYVVQYPRRLHHRKMSIEARYKVARKSAYKFWKLKSDIMAWKHRLNG